MRVLMAILLAGVALPEQLLPAVLRRKSSTSRRR